MDLRTQEIFNNITSKSLNELNSNDVAFIRARRTYLTDDQREKFSELLIERTEETPEKPKKTKK